MSTCSVIIRFTPKTQDICTTLQSDFTPNLFP